LTSEPMPELSIIVPTRNRADRVGALLRRLAAIAGEAAFELLIVDGSADHETEAAVSAARGWLGGPIVYIREPGLPSPPARNVALDAAGASACLFLNDDCWPLPGLLARHAAHHRANPQRGAAMIGRTVPFWPYDPTPFERWLETSGYRHRYNAIADPRNAGGRHFLTFNASAKALLLREVGGFDEKFVMGFEDNELGLRLEAAGMWLAYDPEALVEHFHPTSLAATLRQFRRYGAGRRRLGEMHAEDPRPRRPGPRHRLAAAALLAPYAAGLRRDPIRRRVWRFLCIEAFREGYWNEPYPPGSGLRVGATLATLATRDPSAAEPELDGDPLRARASSR
jgi:GT2 family glycosyltransferase